ncbi:MAG: PGF-CTERM sorting domain-containing protein [Thermoplasmatota archaeon]
MRVSILVGLIAFVALAAPASAATVNDTVQMHDSGSSHYFTVNNGTDQNPTINVNPGDVLNFLVENVGNTQHNFDVKDSSGNSLGVAPASGTYLQPAKNATLQWTVPSNAGGKTYTYICDIHGTPMSGSIKVSGGSSSSSTPGFEGAFAVVGLLGVALLARNHFAK